MSTVETPSKVAAAALNKMDLNVPTKPTTDVMAKLKAAAAEAHAAGIKPAELAVAVKPTTKLDAQPEAQVEELEEFRTRFVGDLACEEKDEPLLQETTARFVLFPIKYREVSLLFAHEVERRGGSDSQTSA